jgi:hypothetical protein
MAADEDWIWTRGIHLFAAVTPTVSPALAKASCDTRPVGHVEDRVEGGAASAGYWEVLQRSPVPVRIQPCRGPQIVTRIRHAPRPRGDSSVLPGMSLACSSSRQARESRSPFTSLIASAAGTPTAAARLGCTANASNTASAADTPGYASGERRERRLLVERTVVTHSGGVIPNRRTLAVRDQASRTVWIAVPTLG